MAGAPPEPRNRRACGAPSRDSPGAIPGTIRLRSNSCNGPGASWSNGATIRPPGVASRFAREEEIDTISAWSASWRDLSRVRAASPTILYKGLAPARALAGWIERSRSRRPPRLRCARKPAAEARPRSATRSEKGSGDYGDGVAREDLLARRDELLRWIEEFRRRADADLAALLREEMTGLVDEYQRAQTALRKAGFRRPADVAFATCVRDQPEVRAYLQNRFTHLFIDEFQDTDPLQAEILLLLAADDPGRIGLAQASRPEAGKAVPGRRSEAVDLQVPARRHGAVPADPRRAGGARRRIRRR